jgi:hypothetical protein
MLKANFDQMLFFYCQTPSLFFFFNKHPLQYILENVNAHSVSYEYGILIRSWACLLVGRDKSEYKGYLNLMKNDFHTIEAGVADIAATL